MSFTPLLMDASYYEDFQRRVLAEVRAMQSLCSPLPLASYMEDGKLGLWLKHKGWSLLIDPVKLLRTVFLASSVLDVEAVYKDGVKQEISFSVHVQREQHVYSFTVFQERVPVMSRYYCLLDEYVHYIRQAFDSFYDGYLDDMPLAYDPESFCREGLWSSGSQLSKPWTFPSVNGKRMGEMQIEPFVFDVTKYGSFHVGFGTGPQARTYGYAYFGAECDLDAVRHCLEMYAYTRETEFSMPYDYHYLLVIKLSHERVQEQVHQEDGQCYFSYRDCVRVEIVTDELDHMPVLVGYCDESQTLRTLYEGLLKLAFGQPDEAAAYIGPGKLTAYRKVKSPVLESLIRDGYYKRSAGPYHCELRHTRIDDVFVYNGTDQLTDLKGAPYSFDSVEKMTGVTRLEEKCLAVLHDMDESMTSQARAEKIATMLRDALPKEYDLWMECPADDSSLLGRKMVL